MHLTLKPRALACGAALLLAAVSLAMTSSAGAATPPSERSISDAQADVVADYPDDDDYDRTDITYVTVGPGVEVASASAFMVRIELNGIYSSEQEGSTYTRSVITKAVDFTYKKVKTKKGKKKVVTARTPYTSRFTYVSTSQEVPAAERLVDGDWEPLDCYVEVGNMPGFVNDTPYFTFEKSCLGPSIDSMTTEVRTSTVNAEGHTFSDFAAVGPIKP